MSSLAKVQVISVNPDANRLRPPPKLRGRERDLFVELVASNPPKHFRPSDMPLLLQYVASATLAEKALAQLRRQPVIDGGNRTSPWLVVFEKASRASIALAMRLRLSPQSRSDPRSVREQGPISYYERTRLESDERDRS
jgi:hypothetical protein